MVESNNLKKYSETNDGFWSMDGKLRLDKDAKTSATLGYWNGILHFQATGNIDRYKIETVKPGWFCGLVTVTQYVYKPPRGHPSSFI